MASLKPCPFCGSDGTPLGEVWTVCSNEMCSLSEDGVLTRDWNTRISVGPQWQPIETAPRNATEILIFTQWEEVAVARYHSNTGSFVTDYEQDSDLNPTHWMPLPAPPEVVNEG